MAFGQFLLSVVTDGADAAVGLFVGVFVVGWCFGALFWAMPTLVMELFGAKHFGANRGFMGLSPAIGGYLLSTVLAGRAYEANAGGGGGGRRGVGPRVRLGGGVLPHRVGDERDAERRRRRVVRVVEPQERETARRGGAAAAAAAARGCPRCSERERKPTESPKPKFKRAFSPAALSEIRSRSRRDAS